MQKHSCQQNIKCTKLFSRCFSFSFFTFFLSFRTWKNINSKARKVSLVISGRKNLLQTFYSFWCRRTYKIAWKRIYDAFNNYSLHYYAKLKFFSLYKPHSDINKIISVNLLKIESSFQYISFNIYLIQNLLFFHHIFVKFWIKPNHSWWYL